MPDADYFALSRHAPAACDKPLTPFRVWAPRARSIDLWLGARRYPMKGEGGGYWSATVDATPGEREIGYRYAIDGGQPVPDPFSRWQPDGVHGESRKGVDGGPTPPRLQRPIPLEQAVIYELHVGTFTPAGTYPAATEKLSHLVNLGVTHIEVMPVATFPGHHGWGYDGVFPFAPHPAYGTAAELKAFVGACHAHGLAVILDVVYNHFGPDGNYLPLFGPCFAQRNKTLWGETLNFDEPGSDGMRRLVLDNATYWLREFGFDGLRLDAVHAIHDGSPIHILQELATQVHQLEEELNRPLCVIAESDLNDPKLVLPQSAGGYGLNAFWADDFHHAVHAFLTGERHGYYEDFSGLRDIARALRDGYIYQGQYAPSRKRPHGHPPGELRRHQLVYCLQNHDQIGNRARGERLGHLISREKAKAAAALLFLSPAVPLLFQGEEWGATTPFLYFTDHQDRKLAQAVSEGRRKEFPFKGEVPDPQQPATYAASKLRWEEIAHPAHREMLDWYRRLIALRRNYPAASCEVNCDEAAGWLTLRRGRLLAIFNFARVAQEVPLPAGKWRQVLASEKSAGPLPADAVRIFADN